MSDITKIKVDGEPESSYQLYPRNNEFAKRTERLGGVSDYTELSNKPKINGVELSGDKTSADYGIGNPTDEQVASSVEAWLDAHPEATTTVADGSVSEEKTTFFTKTNVEMIGEMEVGFRDNSLSGYHKKTVAVEPGKSYIVWWEGWTDYFDESMTAVTSGYTMTKLNAHACEYLLTIPEDSAVRYFRTTIQDVNMTDTIPCMYEGEVRRGAVTRGSFDLVFDYAAEAEVPVLQMSQSGNLIDPSRCSLFSGTHYQMDYYIPVKPGEKYYCDPSMGMLRPYNKYYSFLEFDWYEAGYFEPKKGVYITGNGDGVYTIPEGVAYVNCYVTLKDDNTTDCIIAKTNRPVTLEQLEDDVIFSSASQKAVKSFVDAQHLVGLTFCGLGDSVTNMSNYGALLCAKYGMLNTAGGTDGASYTSTDGLADNQIAYNKVNSLDAATDVVVLMFGTNDISNSREIGTFTDNDLTTLYGALRKTFDLLTTKFTGKRIGVVTSPQRNFNTCTYDKWKQYNDVIKKMAMLYKIPVLDGEYAGLVYGLANDYSHFTDDVHPASAGSAALAYNIGKFIESLPIYQRDGE